MSDSDKSYDPSMFNPRTASLHKSPSYRPRPPPLDIKSHSAESTPRNGPFSASVVRSSLTSSLLPPNSLDAPKSAGYDPLGQYSQSSKNPRPSQTKVDEMIQEAISLHESDRLEESTQLFKKAADMGNATGLYFYGLALRSGWGVKEDPKTAFKYLSKAAEIAVTSTNNLKVATKELVLAIYELGQCFYNGWGVKKDRKTGAFYIQIAANLGDPDAQTDIATYYLNGDGVKKDKVKAAKYFRLAENQGEDKKIPGNSWIWKDKYDACGVKQKVSRR